VRSKQRAHVTSESTKTPIPHKETIEKKKKKSQKTPQKDQSQLATQVTEPNPKYNPS